MNYKKPALVAKSEPKHSFVAGCPTNRRPTICANCEITK